MICIWITVTGCSPLTVVWTAIPHIDKQSTIDQIQQKVDQTYTLLHRAGRSLHQFLRKYSSTQALFCSHETKSTSTTGFPVLRSHRFIAVTVLHLSLLSQRRLQLYHTENYFPVKTTSHNLHSIFSALMLIATWCPCDFAHHSNEHVSLRCYINSDKSIL